MFLSLMDKVDFISQYLGVKVDRVDKEGDIFNLVDGNIVVLKDDQGTHYYKADKFFESADLSIELRNFAINMFDKKGDEENKIRYCRHCVGVIANELVELAKKEEILESESDKLAAREQREMLDKQAMEISGILEYESFRHDFSEGIEKEDEREM